MSSVVLKGLKRELKYTVYALCELGRELGMDVDDPAFASKLGFRKVVYLLWAGLLHETQHLPKSKQLSIDAVMKMVPVEVFGKEFDEIREAVVSAFIESQGLLDKAPATDEEEKKTNPEEISEES